MATEFATYVDFREVNGGSPCTLGQFHTALQSFPRNLVLRVCSVLNTHVASWAGEYTPETQARLLPGFFLKEISDYIIASGRPVFHRHQLLFVAQEALRICHAAESDSDRRAWRGLGIVFLMANDQLGRTMPRIADSAENIAGMIASLVPTLEANNVQSYLLKMARSYLMLSRFAEPLRMEKFYFDVPHLFETATKIPLDIFQALLFGAISRFARFDKLRASTNLEDYTISGAWFGQRGLSSEQVDLFLADLSATPDELAAAIDNQKPKADDFTLLRDKPLFSHGNVFFPFDFTFLAEKFDSGPFWRVNFHIENSKRERFHSFWGSVFERYMNWIFESFCAGGPNRFYPNPVYLDGAEEQVCDGIIVSGDTAILMEYKGSTFTARGKYGGDAKTLQKELEEKLVGTPKKRKGVRQLAEAIERLGRQANPVQIKGIDLSNVRTLLPLVVTRDGLGSAFGMNTYLQFRFEELKPKLHLNFGIISLFCLSADDIEKVTPYLSDTSLLEILLARLDQEPSLFSPFWTVRNKVLEKTEERKPQWVYDALRELVQMSAKRLGISREEERPNPTHVARTK